MANGELVLLYNIEGDKARKLKMIFVQNGIKIRTVTEAEYEVPLGVLAGVLTAEEAAKAPEDIEWPEAPKSGAISEEMLVMKGIFGKRLDILLAAMRRIKATVALKAVVTEHNAYWNSLQLYQEIKREHEVMTEGLPMDSEDISGDDAE